MSVRMKGDKCFINFFKNSIEYRVLKFYNSTTSLEFIKMQTIRYLSKIVLSY